MADPAGPIGPIGPLPPGLLPPPPSIFGGGPGRKGPSGWAQLALLVGVVVLATAGWSIWSLVRGPSHPVPRPPVAVPSPTSSSSPTTTPSPTTTAAVPTPPVSRPPSSVGQPVGRATQVAPTPLPVADIGTQPARVRFEVASSAGSGDVSYGSNSGKDIALHDQPLPFAVEVTVPRNTGFIYVLGSDYGEQGTSTTMRCRIYVNAVLIEEQLSSRSCIAGFSISTVFGS